MGLSHYSGGAYGAPFAGLMDYLDDCEVELVEDLREQGTICVPDD